MVRLLCGRVSQWISSFVLRLRGRDSFVFLCVTRLFLDSDLNLIEVGIRVREAVNRRDYVTDLLC